MIDDYAVAFEVQPMRKHNCAAVSGPHRGAHVRAKIHPFVNAGQLAVVHAPYTKAIGRRCNQPVRENCRAKGALAHSL